MLGAILGDIVGSRFEWNNIKSKDFDLLTYKCFTTDDSIMSLAVAKAILESKLDYSDLSENAVKSMVELGRLYPNSGYGGMFRQWIFSDNHKPYNSFGNGSAMRVSACGFAAKTLEEAKFLSKKVTEVSHNHPEGLKGAECVAVAIFMALHGSNILEIRDYINDNYYSLNFTLDQIRDSYKFNETCQNTVPQAIMAFLESESFEDAIRNAISIGGDSDTIAAITGGIAEAYYGIPTELRKHALTFLDERLLNILIEFENKFTPQMEKDIEGKTIAIKTKERKNVEGFDRESVMKSAVDAAEDDLLQSKTSKTETTSQKLFNHLFEVCNILRGPINQDEYKSYAIPILFYKRLSDVYDEETQKALEESDGDLEYASFAENHSFVIPENCHWNDIRKCTENVGYAIVTAMTNIERANPDTLFGVFSSFDDANWTDKTKLSDSRLKDLIEHMSKIKVGNNNYSADVMGDAYEFLIKKFADLSKKNAGEFYTPRSIVKLMVNILNPKSGESVYDPACGTGGMLIEAIRHMKNDKLSYGKIYGQEKNLSTSAIARMNLFLHGAKDFKVTQGDTLRNPNYLYRGQLQTFDCVIANPPFSLKNWGAEQFISDIYGRNMWGCPPESSADYAWLQHMVASMDNKNGRCAVVLSQGVLFHSGKESEIRQKLVESDKLEYIITLQKGVFYNTGVSACILILNNNKPDDHKGKILLVDGSTIYTPQRAQNIMTEDDINKIYKLVQEYDNIGEVTKVITIEDAGKQDFNLSFNNYIIKEKEETASYEEVKRQFIQSVQDVREAEEKLKELLRKGGFIQ